MKTTTINTSDYPVLEENGFQIVTLNEKNLPIYQKGLTRAYKDVFNASAWREGVKCASGCGYKTTFEEAPDKCPDCSGKIEDYYSDAEVVDSVLSVMSKTYFQCLVLLNEEKVAGFTWGWKDCLNGINEEKLGLGSLPRGDSIRYLELLKNMEEKNIKTGNTYYQSETGIVPEYRTRGVGTALVGMNERLLQENKDKVNTILQRTSRKSPMFTIRKNLGYTEVFSYNDEDERVLFAKNNI